MRWRRGRGGVEKEGWEIEYKDGRVAQTVDIKDIKPYEDKEVQWEAIG